MAQGSILGIWPWSQLAGGMRIAFSINTPTGRLQDDHRLQVLLLCTALAGMVGAFRFSGQIGYRKFLQALHFPF